MLRRFAAMLLLVGAVNAHALEIRYSFTHSTLQVVDLMPGDGVPAGFTTDEQGWSAAQWTNVANWRWTMSLYSDYTRMTGPTVAMPEPVWLLAHLAPWTEVQWDVESELFVSVFNHPDGLEEYAEVATDFCDSSDGLLRCADTRESFASHGADGTYSTYLQVRHRTFTLSNHSDEPAFFQLGADFVLLDSSLTVPRPVPEPATVALLVAGLVAMGARRRLRAAWSPAGGSSQVSASASGP